MAGVRIIWAGPGSITVNITNAVSGSTATTFTSGGSPVSFPTTISTSTTFDTTTLRTYNVSVQYNGTEIATAAGNPAVFECGGDPGAKLIFAPTIPSLNIGTGAPLASPAFTGTPTAPTQSPLDNSTKLATTAYSDAAVAVEKARALGVEATLPSTYASHRVDRAPQVNAPLQNILPITVTNNLTVAVEGRNGATGVYYGVNTSTGHYVTSTDAVTWTDQTYSVATYTPSAIGWEFDATYMYVYSSTGRIWRAPLNNFNTWTEITVSTKPAGTTGRPGSLCALGSSVLLYGNYNASTTDGAHVWRSTDAGATWSLVIDLAGARHVHTVNKSPITGYAWASIGDATYTGIGLYRSKDNGVTWTLVSNNDYGIDMVFVAASGERPGLVIMEGDGLNRPHLFAFPEDGAPGGKTFPLVWYNGAPTDPLTTRGTVRGICLTPNGDITYFTTTEGGAVGSRAGVWVAQGPDFTRAILLLETTGSEPPSYGRCFVQGSTIYMNQTSFPLPTFGSY